MINKLKINQPNRSAMADGFSVRVVDAVPATPQVSLAVQQAASQLGIEPIDILRLVARGELAAVNIEGRYHIDEADLRAAMKTIRRWRVPGGLLAVDYNAERKVRERLLKFAKAATSDEVVLAEMKRLVRPGLPLESVSTITLEFRSAPVGFVESLNDASTAGEFTVSIRGEEQPAPSTVGADYARSRVMANLNRQYESKMSLVGDKAGYLYSSPEVYRRMVSASLERCRSELLTCRETRLVQTSVKTIEHGSTIEQTIQRVPVNISYLLQSEALGISWDRIARESL